MLSIVDEEWARSKVELISGRHDEALKWAREVNGYTEYMIIALASRLDEAYASIMATILETGIGPHYTDVAAALDVPVEDGKALVHQLMHGVADISVVSADTPMNETLVNMTEKGFGMACVVEQGRLVGVISDGDLRRNMANLMDFTAGEMATPLSIWSGSGS